MATQRKLRRGTALQMLTFTGAQDEITQESDTGRLVIHDGSTAGGAFKIPTVSDVQKGLLYYALAGGTADALTLDFGAGLRPAAYTTGMKIRFKVASNNTGAATVNVTGSGGSGLGAKTLKKNIADDLEADDLVTGAVHEAVYDGTNFQVTTLASGGGDAPLARVVASAQASIDFTSAVDWTAYDVYEFDVSNLYASGAGTDVVIRVTADGGSNWKATGYVSRALRVNTSGPSVDAAVDRLTTGIDIMGVTASMPASLSDALSGRVRLTKPNVAGSKAKIAFEFEGGGHFVRGAGYWNTDGAVNGVRFVPTGAVNLTGTIAVYGRRTS